METLNDQVDFEEMVEEFVLPAMKAHYRRFTKLQWQPSRYTGIYSTGAFWLSGNRLLKPDNERWVGNPDIKDRVKNEVDALMFIGHGSKEGVTEGGGDAFVMRDDLRDGRFKLAISSGCHNGLLPAARQSPKWTNNWFPNAALDANAALIAIASYDVSESFLGDQLDVYHDQMRRLIVERLFDPKYETIGDVVEAAHKSYGLRGDDNDIRTLHTVHLFGLPTQRIQRVPGGGSDQASPGATGSQRLAKSLPAGPALAAIPQAIQTISRSVLISHFEVVTDAQGRVGFFIPHNGGLTGEAGTPGRTQLPPIRQVGLTCQRC